jgi:uncharacterized protein (DUF1499 family)
MAEETKSRRGRYAVSKAGLIIACLAGATAVVAGPGFRIGLWTFRDGFEILKWAAYGALPAVIISIVGMLYSLKGPRVALMVSILGIVIGLVTLYLPISWRYMALTVPAIHDITTDTVDPPVFRAVLKARGRGSNTTVYGGPTLAAKQKAAYPDIKTLYTELAPEEAFKLALSAAREIGWEIVDVDPAGLRLEATDTTFWFGFKDDISVRIRLTDEGSRVDVRSISRVGKSDVGTNAKRIRGYIKRYSKKIGSV